MMKIRLLIVAVVWTLCVVDTINAFKISASTDIYSPTIADEILTSMTKEWKARGIARFEAFQKTLDEEGTRVITMCDQQTASTDLSEGIISREFEIVAPTSAESSDAIVYQLELSIDMFVDQNCVATGFAGCGEVLVQLLNNGRVFDEKSRSLGDDVANNKVRFDLMPGTEPSTFRLRIASKRQTCLYVRDLKLDRMSCLTNTRSPAVAQSSRLPEKTELQCQCALGYHWNNLNATCQRCPTNHYSDTVWSTSCIKCPTNSYRKSGSAGISVDDCECSAAFEKNPNNPKGECVAFPHELDIKFRGLLNGNTDVVWTKPTGSQQGVKVTVDCAIGCEMTTNGLAVKMERLNDTFVRLYPFDMLNETEPAVVDIAVDQKSVSAWGISEQRCVVMRYNVTNLAGTTHTYNVKLYDHTRQTHCPANPLGAVLFPANDNVGWVLPFVLIIIVVGAMCAVLALAVCSGACGEERRGRRMWSNFVHRFSNGHAHPVSGSTIIIEETHETKRALMENGCNGNGKPAVVVVEHADNNGMSSGSASIGHSSTSASPTHENDVERRHLLTTREDSPDTTESSMTHSSVNAR